MKLLSSGILYDYYGGTLFNYYLQPFGRTGALKNHTIVTIFLNYFT